MKDLKGITGTKFLFDDNLISYADLVQLLENNGLNTKFIKKPLEENLRVHSLYIKSDFEVAYLAHSNSAEDIYAAAGDFVKQYTETTLYEVLKSLGYCDIQSSKHQKEKKQTKSKFLTLTNENDEYIFIKKKIDLFIYKNYKLEIIYNNKCYYFEMSKERYKEVKTELMS